MIHFDLPKEQSSILKVIGVGGGGSNAVNHMFSQKIDGVNFIICNTDQQAIKESKVPNKIQLGPHLTQGLGAGANPAIGRQATEESLEEIRRILEVNTKMAFITAGMGGGTGTGGAPIVARICKELGILTVGIVTTPFAYEGKKRLAQAEEGILALKEHVDTLLVISNDKLRNQFGNLKMREAFGKADDILATAAKCITDVINSTGQINVDFADVCTVMKNGGVAILGSATAEGENRAQQAIEQAIASPLLNDNDIRGARWILININSAEGEHEFTMDEVEVIQEYLISQAGPDSDVILGLGYDNTLGNRIGITLIATGFEGKDPFGTQHTKASAEPEKIVMELEIPVPAQPVVIQPLQVKEDIHIEEKPLEPVSEEIKAAEIRNNTIEVNEEAIPDNTPEPMPEEAFMELILVEKNEGPEEIENPLVEIPGNSTGDNLEEAPIFFEISSAADQAPIIEFDALFEEPVSAKSSEPQPATPVAEKISEQEASNRNSLSSGGYLAKPLQIYAEEPLAGPESKSAEEPLPLLKPEQADEPVSELQLVVKEDQNAAEDKPIVQQTQPFMNSTVEEPALQDEAEELRRRAKERVAKLRNLSFNTQATDPNNEFETVPAYLRRNMELHNQIAEVEQFYSNYTVKAGENNPAEISTINTFLEGKKPD